MGRHFTHHWNRDLERSSATNLGFVLQDVDAAQRQEQMHFALLRSFERQFVRCLETSGSTDDCVQVHLSRITERSIVLKKKDLQVHLNTVKYHLLLFPLNPQDLRE